MNHQCHHFMKLVAKRIQKQEKNLNSEPNYHRNGRFVDGGVDGRN